MVSFSHIATAVAIATAQMVQGYYKGPFTLGITQNCDGAADNDACGLGMFCDNQLCCKLLN